MRQLDLHSIILSVSELVSRLSPLMSCEEDLHLVRLSITHTLILVETAASWGWENTDASLYTEHALNYICTILFR